MTLSLEEGATDGLDIDQFKVFLYGKYCKSYANQILNFVIKNGKDFLENPSKLLSAKVSVGSNALKSMVFLSKYLGCYEDYKAKLKSYGIKWCNGDTAFNGFLSIFSKKHDTLGAWVNKIQPFPKVIQIANNSGLVFSIFFPDVKGTLPPTVTAPLIDTVHTIW